MATLFQASLEVIWDNRAGNGQDDAASADGEPMKIFRVRDVYQ